jgi:hypothetical protein
MEKHFQQVPTIASKVRKKSIWILKVNTVIALTDSLALFPFV